MHSYSFLLSVLRFLDRCYGSNQKVFNVKGGAGEETIATDLTYTGSNNRETISFQNDKAYSSYTIHWTSASNGPGPSDVQDVRFFSPPADASGNGHAGELRGGASFVAGKIGNALSGDSVAIRSIDINSGMSTFSISLWFKGTGTGTLVGSDNNVGGSNAYYAHVSGNNFGINLEGGTANVMTSLSGTGVQDGEWHHGVVARTIGSTVLPPHSGWAWADADPETMGHDNGGLGSNLAWTGVCLGTLYCTGNPAIKYGGEIDEVALFNRALTQSAVTQLYNGGAGVAFTSATQGGLLFFLDSFGRKWRLKMELEDE